MRDPKEPTSSKIVYKNQWITVHEDKTITPDGTEGLYAFIESKDSCMVVALDNENHIYLHKAFRYPSRSYGWELPGGGGDGEDLIQASKRELEEETGIIAEEWQKIGEAYVCNGLLREKMAVCLAKNISFDGTKENSPEETFADAGFFSQNEIKDMIKSGQINDCQTLAALMYYLNSKTDQQNPN